jgi:hypothetical protein
MNDAPPGACGIVTRSRRAGPGGAFLWAGPVQRLCICNVPGRLVAVPPQWTAAFDGIGFLPWVTGGAD